LLKLSSKNDPSIDTIFSKRTTNSKQDGGMCKPRVDVDGMTVSSPPLEEEEEMVALLLPRSYSELSERRDWFALRKRLLLLAKSGRGAPDTDTEPVSSLKTENELRKSRKPLESCHY
jgi:hypothetical protein